MISTNEPFEIGEGLGESCAEPSEGGMLKPLTAESIIARWMSMIIETVDECEEVGSRASANDTRRAEGVRGPHS